MKKIKIKFRIETGQVPEGFPGKVLFRGPGYVVLEQELDKDTYPGFLSLISDHPGFTVDTTTDPEVKTILGKIKNVVV